MDNYESLRERTLWFPPVPPPGYKSRQTSLQSQSPIFAMLPPEIRRLIWIGCLGGFTLSLDFSSQHICDWFQSIFSGVDESEAEIWRELKYLGPRRIDVEPGLLPILLTCQRVYSEAIGILYSCNEFSLPDTNYRSFIHVLLLPPHFNTIRFLDFTVQIDAMSLVLDQFSEDQCEGSETWWTSQFNTIASMESLRELHIQMTVSPRWQRDWIREQISLLNPLKLITKPKVFVVTLPFRDPAENESALQEMPFQIQRAPKTING